MLPDGFVRLSEFCPSIQIAANYATEDNFTGQVVKGYRKIEAIFSLKGAERLCQVQAQAQRENLGLKIFDAYRPVKAVQSFLTWGQLSEEDQVLKQRYYPHYSKAELFELGYIARQSSHSRGSAVDLTLVDAQGQELDMGTIFDFFDPRSHTLHPKLSAQQIAHRRKLKELMEAQGFKNYSKEWWHYSLVEEAFPGQSFDFDVH